MCALRHLGLKNSPEYVVKLSVEFSYYFILLPIVLFAVWREAKHWRFNKRVKFLNNQSLIQQVEIDHLQIYKKVVENSPDLFVIVDQSMQVVVANKTAAAYGWGPSKAFLSASISDTSKLHFEFELKSVLKAGDATNGEIRLVQTQEKNWKYYLYHIFPVLDEQDQIVGATITALDVTAQREAEVQLNTQREFLESVMNAIPDAIYVKDDHHRLLYGNKSFSKIVGKNPGDYVGLKHEEVFSAGIASVMRKQDAEVLRTNIPSDVEEEIYDSEGRRLTVLSKRTPLQFQDGRKVLISIMRDFSDRKRLESELHISKIRQSEASRLATLGATASGIAHEINNPLNVLVGIAELMKSKFEREGKIEKEKINDYCDRIVAHSMRIAKIVKGLRSISRDASNDPFDEVSLTGLVEETLELCRQQFNNRGIQLNFKMPHKPILIDGRFAQLSQILMNLINNARDAIEGIKDPTIWVEIQTSPEEAYLRVWDNGPGISADIENKIMTPFFTTKPAGKGTGLGLSISRSIAVEHGGTLILNRNVGNSCFELQLPLLKKQNIGIKDSA